MILQATVTPNLAIITNRLLFGPFLGGFLSWITILIGATFYFALSKRFGKPLAVRLAGRSLPVVEKFFERHGLPAVFLARITPFVPFDAVSYVAAIAGVSYCRFLIATAIGLVPSIIVYTYLGSVAVKPLWWIVCVAVILLPAGWTTLRMLHNRAQPARELSRNRLQLRPHRQNSDKLIAPTGAPNSL